MNYKKLFSLKNLYVGQLGVIINSKNTEGEWIPFENNSFIVFSKKKKNRRVIEDKDAVDIFSGAEYYIFKDYCDGAIGCIFLNNCIPLTMYVNEQEKRDGMISGRRIVEIFYNLNNSKENKKENHGDQILYLIFDIIEKIKKTNLIIENKEMYYATLTNLATDYVSKLIELKSRDYNLEDTSELLIRELKQDIINKLNIITANIGKEHIDNETLTRTLEKK